MSKLSVRRIFKASPSKIVFCDWTRTATRSWQNRPTEPPLEVVTRQRRRDFATPENLLTVATLLEYANAVQSALESESILTPDSTFVHPLHDILHHIEREWIFPQFAGLKRQGEEIITGHHTLTPDQLELLVAERLLPGQNSAYDDLLAWRHKLRTLRLMEQTQITAAPPMLGANPARDNYLYQVWIFYELGDYLNRTLGRESVEWQTAAQQITFTWQTNESTRTYHLRHDQTVPQQWANTPGLRPDFYIVPADAVTVLDEKQVVWSELGFILDAKYYRLRENARTPAGPIKRMIADLALAGVQHGALLFAFHGAPLGQDQETEVGVEATQTSHIVRPLPHAQRAVPDVTITNYQVSPTRLQETTTNDSVWFTLLNQVHRAIGQRLEPRCYGVFADTLTATAQGVLWAELPFPDYKNLGTSIPADELVFCPKPHIGRWRVDLVSASADCCKTAVCHIRHLKAVQSPRRLQRLEDVAEAIKSVSTDLDDEERARVATQQVKVIVERYASLLAPHLDDYRQRVKTQLFIQNFDTTPLLTDEQRNTLALADFLLEQIERIHAQNYSGPLLLYAGVLEEVIGATMATELNRLKPRLVDFKGNKLNWTLGNFGHYHRNKNEANYHAIKSTIVGNGHWNENSGMLLYSFDIWLGAMDTIATIRNKAAHAAKASRQQYNDFYEVYRGSPHSGFGGFSGLLAAWR